MYFCSLKVYFYTWKVYFCTTHIYSSFSGPSFCWSNFKWRDMCLWSMLGTWTHPTDLDSRSQTIVWNGPMGVFEMKVGRSPFQADSSFLMPVSESKGFWDRWLQNYGLNLEVYVLRVLWKYSRRGTRKKNSSWWWWWIFKKFRVPSTETHGGFPTANFLNFKGSGTGGLLTPGLEVCWREVGKACDLPWGLLAVLFYGLFWGGNEASVTRIVSCKINEFNLKWQIEHLKILLFWCFGRGISNEIGDLIWYVCNIYFDVCIYIHTKH